MQELKHNDTTIDYSDVVKELQTKLNRKIDGVPVVVSENYEDDAIEITINDQSVIMTLKQARDFLMEVNKSINLVSRNYRSKKVQKIRQPK